MLSLSVLCFSCKKFLDLQPEDKYTENQTYSTVRGFQTALNGIYLGIVSDDLYGGKLTISIADILAQRYNLSSDHIYYKIGSQAYTDVQSMSAMAGIWTSGFHQILACNKLLEALKKDKDVLKPGDRAIMKGEAYALRAMLHFDIFRLFGPVYDSPDSTAAKVPYYSLANGKEAPLIPGNRMMDSILIDLDSAAANLTNDPVLTKGVELFVPNEDNFYRRRNLRLNAFAVRALQARVLLYRKDKVGALAAATDVINKASGYFPWVKPDSILAEKTNPNRVFSTEILLGLYNSNLYNQQDKYFSGKATTSTILAPTDAKLSTAFDGNVNDYRYGPCWIVPTTGGKSYRCFAKYEDVVDRGRNWRYIQPLIRMSEMYFIAAEATTVQADAINYLNVIHKNRNVPDLATTAVIATELQKEYRKEFFGEGQLFFFYKRKKITSVPTGGAASTVTISYNIPMPTAESVIR